MATSGSKSVAVTSYDTLTISWTCDSQSTANNTSTCTFKAQLISTSSGRISSTASKSYTATVNGTEYTGTNTVGIAASSTLTLWSKTITIAHDSDGSKSFTFSFAQTFAITFSGTYIGTVSASCTVELPDIARASSITSAAAVTLGNAVSVKWTPASSAFAYKLKFVVGSGSYTTGYISPGSTSAYTYTGYTMAIATWAPYITTSTAATCTVTLYTYSSSSSSTAIGSATGSFTVTVPSSVVPSVSIGSVAEGNSAVTIGAYVKGKSKAAVTFTGTSVYSSALASYTLTVGSLTYTGTPTSGTAVTKTSGTLTTSGTITVKVTVTDKRGRSASASTTITVYDYSAPSVTTFKAVRCTSDGTADTNGAYVKLTYAYSVSSVNSKNTASMTIKWKLSSASSYSNTAVSSTSTSVSSTSKVLSDTFDTESSYTFQLTLTDAFSTTTKTVTVSTALFPIDVYADGTGVAIGKVAESSSLLDVAWPSSFGGNLTVTATDLACGTTESTEEQRLRVRNSLVNGYLYASTSGELGIYNSTLNTILIRQAADGTVTLGGGSQPTKIIGTAITANGYAIPQILTGGVTITAAASSITEQAVTFSTAFSSAPLIFLSIYSTTTSANYGNITVMYANASTTGFTIRVANANTSSYAPLVRWMAVLL